MSKPKLIMCCYGGGHVQSLAPVCQLLTERDVFDIQFIGFTTARKTLENMGIDCCGYEVFTPYIDASLADFSLFDIPEVGHPDISHEAHRAYYLVGIQDLIREHGVDRALEIYNDQGRVAFEPRYTMAQFLKDEQPVGVVTTSSPRSELAIIRAASELGIKSISVSDLFLIQESRYICTPGYATAVTVISDYVKGFLESFDEFGARAYVTGNPAFDDLYLEQHQSEGAELRKTLGVSSQDKLLTWVGSPGGTSLRGLKFIELDEAVEVFKSICEQPGMKYGIRPHPNAGTVSIDLGESGHLLASEYSIESVLWASDVVVFETSTVGLQAALIGKKAIAVGEEDYPPYKKLGLAERISKLSELPAFVQQMVLSSVSETVSPDNSCSAEKVANIVCTELL